MTLDQLIDALKELKQQGADGDLPVIMEGCDCDGIAETAEIGAGCVYLKRPE